MSRFDDMICGLRQDMEIPENVWKKYTDTLLELPDKTEKPSHTFSKRRLWPTVAAATVAVGAITVSASAYIRWSRGLEDGLQTTAEQRQVLEENQMASFVEQSVTQGDVTVTAQQSIVDNYFAHLSFKVEGYEVEEGISPGFSHMDITVGDCDVMCDASFYNGLIPGDGGEALHADGTPLADGEKVSYTMDDGSMEYQVLVMSDEKGALIGKPIHVELKDLGLYGEEENVAVEAEGEWIFDWVLTGSDSVETYELNAPLEDSGVTVLQAELSPISISVKYEFPRRKETEHGTNEKGEDILSTVYAEAPAFTGVRLKDGTICTGLSGGGTSGYASEDSDIYEYTVALTRIIDVEQVESLLFVKSYPEGEGEQPLTEENLYFLSVEK